MPGLREPPSVDAYGGGGFRVSGAWRPGSLLILDDVPRGWAAGPAAALAPADFEAVIAAGAAISEFVLLGTGAVQALPPRAVREALRAVGIGLEFMSTEAACRMHNVLAQEGRRFATALIAI
jgi:uncharacterized protein